MVPKRRPVPPQVRHLRNGVSQIDTSHMTKPTTAVIIAPVPAACVSLVLAKNTAAKTKTHPMSVMIPWTAGECNKQPGASLASPGAQAGIRYFEPVPVHLASGRGLTALHAGSRTVEPADQPWMPPLHQAGDLRARGSENPAWAAGPFLSPSSEQAFAAQAMPTIT
jgi:hypothetical protein